MNPSCPNASENALQPCTSRQAVSEAVLRLKRFAFGGVVRHKEVLDLVDEVLVQVIERPHVTMVAELAATASRRSLRSVRTRSAQHKSRR